ncbi:MAG: GGDEF domain-containing protein [Clostridia bacterium]
MLNIEIINIIFIFLLAREIAFNVAIPLIERKKSLFYAGSLFLVSIFCALNYYFGSGSIVFLILRFILYMVLIYFSLYLMLKKFNILFSKYEKIIAGIFAGLLCVILILFTVFGLWQIYDNMLAYNTIYPITFVLLLPIIYGFIKVLCTKKLENKIDYAYFLYVILFFCLDFFIPNFHIFTLAFTLALFSLSVNLKLQANSYDFLTKVKNRNTFDKFVAKFKPQDGIIFFMDMDRLKSINDKFGHHQGDVSIANFAELINNCAENTDKIFRIGGDEFAVFSENINSQFENKLKNAIICYSRTHKIPISISIGSAITTPSCNIENVLNQADKNMYKNKSLKNNNYFK